MALILLLWLWLEFRIRERQAWLRWLFRVMGLAGAVVLYVLILAAVAIPFGRDF
jgi:hypothetical protein